MAQWDPFADMDQLRREIDRAFEGYASAEGPPHRVAFLPGRGPRRYPLMNLFEDKENLYIEALTPGVNPDSFDVTVMQNRLTLSGEKDRIAGEVNPEAFHRTERSSGKFVRNFQLPVEINEERMQAEYKNGLLMITLPKAEKAKPRQVSVKVT